MFRYFIILLFFVTKCDSRCTNKSGYVYCDSFKDAKKLGDQKNWTELYIKSFGEQETIEPNFLKQMPQVYRIEFENMVIEIQDNSFVADGLSPLTDLKFFDCDLPVIKKNWFSNSSINWLDIIKSNVTSFEERCFDGLKTISIEDNNITRINANVFNATLISSLYLVNNQIRFIEENAIANMTELSTISLEKNLLTSFNSKIIAGIQKNSTLNLLVLKYNQIKYLDEDSFVAFPNIQFIYLNSNELELIHEGTFNGLNKLFTLDLSFNKLKSFPESALPYNGLQSLEYLHLHRNRFNYLPRHFIRNFPKLEEISVFENPWQCACYKEMLNTILVHHKNVKISCSEGYLKGEGPVCFVPETNNYKCTENIQYYNDLGNIFTEALSELNEYPEETLYNC